MAKTSEPVLGLAVMQVLSTQPKGEATVRTLIKYVPDYVNFTAEDQQQIWATAKRTNVGTAGAEPKIS